MNQEQLFAAFPVNRSITESTVHFYDEFVKPTFMKKHVQGRDIGFGLRVLRIHDFQNDYLSIAGIRG